MNPLIAAAAALASPFRKPFRLIGFGVLGGSRGSNPYPAPRTDRFLGGQAYIRETYAPKLEINQQPQPWQKHAAKLKARRLFVNAGWNDRREARQQRIAAAIGVRMIELAVLKAG